MKKFLLTLMVPWIGLSIYAQDTGTTPTPSESLDFTVDDITYTILDEQEKTCQTKAGYSYIDYEQRKLVFVYGNTIPDAVTIPATVQKPNSNDTYTVVAVGSYGFDKAPSVTISEGITQISEYAFLDNKSLSSISIPESVSSIGRNAFYNCTALTNVTLPTGLTSIEPYTFSYSGIISVSIPGNVVAIGDNAFAYCSDLQEVTLPGTVLTLGKSIFQSCSGLSTLTIGEGISSIPAYTFSGCNALTTLTIPSSVNTIGDYGFNISGLTSITCQSRNLPVISSNSFNSVAYTNATLYVYKTVLSNYENSQLWGNFVNIQPIEMPATSITISPSTLNINVGLTSQLNAIPDPIDATGDIIWALVSASPANCIEIDANGMVTARQIGTARVSATLGSQTATCDVVVTANPDESVVINPPVGDIYIGDSLTLSAVVFPTTIIPNLTWSSSNPNVATIDSKTGQLNALSDGATVITATNDNVNGTIAITVKPIEASSITLDQESITLKVGNSQTLVATISPDNTTHKDVTWDTNDPSVAVVSDGVVTAVGVGTANIRAMVSSVTANCVVTVNPIEAESITLSATSQTLFIGQSLQLTGTVNPENTTDKTINWISDNASVASVSTTGEVLAISQGTANITAECGNAMASCTITVLPISSEALLMNYSAISLKAGATQQLTATVYPENTTDQTITWETSEEGVATVENGLVTAISVGVATITAKNGNQTASCVVTVEPVLAEQVILDLSSVSVNVGANVTLTGSVLPANVTDNTLVWASLNSDIAEVAGGVITGVAPGSTYITASCGNAVASCSVTVLQPASSITLNESSLALYVGDLFDLIETVLPANTTDVVTWTSSDANVATVDENGIVMAIKAGTATITATCGEKTATCEVTVSDIAATSVELDYSELALIKGQSQQLIATVLPENTTFPVVTWASTDTSVATVSEDGTVKAIGAGTASITASCGEVSAECIVSVSEPEPEDVVLNFTSISLKASETFQLELVNPENVSASEVTWTSSDTNVATISETGLVTAVEVGETAVTASYNGVSASCIITVLPTQAESVELNYSELSLEIDDSYQLKATVYPATTTDPTVIWFSSNPDVASVSLNGEVLALSAGSTIITAMCGNVYASCNVIVIEDESSVIKQLVDYPEDGYYRVYNINGVNILTTKNPSDLNNLYKGMFIINGKKVIIK